MSNSAIPCRSRGQDDRADAVASSAEAKSRGTGRPCADWIWRPMRLGWEDPVVDDDCPTAQKQRGLCGVGEGRPDGGAEAGATDMTPGGTDPTTVTSDWANDEGGETDWHRPRRKRKQGIGIGETRG
jgi:hypothetical protein